MPTETDMRHLQRRVQFPLGGPPGPTDVLSSDIDMLKDDASDLVVFFIHAEDDVLDADVPTDECVSRAKQVRQRLVALDRAMDHLDTYVAPYRVEAKRYTRLLDAGEVREAVQATLTMSTLAERIADIGGRIADGKRLQSHPDATAVGDAVTALVNEVGDPGDNGLPLRAETGNGRTLHPRRAFARLVAQYPMNEPAFGDYRDFPEKSRSARDDYCEAAGPLASHDERNTDGEDEDGDADGTDSEDDSEDGDGDEGGDE